MNKDRIKEIVLYLFFGGMTTAVSWGSYALLVKGLGCNIAVGNTLSWIMAVLFAFATNKQFVFRSRSWQSNIMIPELFKFLGARLGTGVLEIVGVPLLVKLGFDYTLFGVKGAWSKIVVSFVVVVLNYVFSKVVIFKSDK